MFLIGGEKEAIYNNLRSAIRSARQLIPNARIEIIPSAHNVAAVANPEQVNQNSSNFFLNNTYPLGQ